MTKHNLQQLEEKITLLLVKVQNLCQEKRHLLNENAQIKHKNQLAMQKIQQTIEQLKTLEKIGEESFHEKE